MEIKFVILFLLVAIFSAAWIFSKSSKSKKLYLTEKMFVVSNIALLLLSLSGLVFTFILGEAIMTSHLFEIVLLPSLIIFLVIMISNKNKNAEEKYDEKQIQNMKDAVTFSWSVILFALLLIYAAYDAGNLHGIVFFPIIFYLAFTAYSGSLIYYYIYN